MVLREEITIAWLRMSIFQEDRSRQGRSGDLTPSFLAGGTRPTGWFFGSNPVDLHGRGDGKDEDLPFA